MSACVFVGPSLAVGDARAVLDATFLPPAKQGDVHRVVSLLRPRVVGIIDGYFQWVPSVWHKEILWAMHQGVHVFGAASMGALRAAELAPFGMRGYGFIHRWYAQTLLADDDEVAVAMSPPELGAAPLSEALINMRLTLRRAERAGIVSGPQRRALEGLARDTHFVDRGYPRLIADAGATFGGSWRPALGRLEDWLPSGAIDRKREDAAGLLRRLARPMELPDMAPKPPPFRLTEAWAYDLDAAGLWDYSI